MGTEQGSGLVDRVLAEEDPRLHAHGVVVAGLDARLILIDARHNIDRFHILQAVEDPDSGNSLQRYYCYQRWGVVGWRGARRLDGPTTLPKVEAQIAKVFKEKTGKKWGSVGPGHLAKPGHYWLQHNIKPAAGARWEYFVSESTGWHPYLADAAVEVEELHAQHVADGRDARTARRVVQSGRFSYEVDLENMKQRNTRTGTVRDVRRILSPAAARRGVGRLPPGTMKAPGKAAVKAVQGVVVSKPLNSNRTTAVKAAVKAAVKKVRVVKKVLKKKGEVAKGKWRPPPAVSSRKTEAEDWERHRKKNKKGRLVCAKISDAQRSNAWCVATVTARKELQITGFQPVGGTTALGKRLLKRTRELWLAGKAAKVPEAAMLSEDGQVAE